jgi:hypothetical protein
MASWVGNIFKKWDNSADHFKYHIIVGDISGSIAFVYINTEARYFKLPQQLQGTQLPVSPDEFTFLDHDSFVDCSTVQELDKGEVNTYLQANPGHNCGCVQQSLMDNILRLVIYSKSVEIWKKEKYGLTPA